MIKTDQLSLLPFRSPPEHVSAELVESIRAHGFHYPIIITPKKEIVDGQNVVAAARILGIDKVPAVEVRLWRQVIDILARRNEPTAVGHTPVTAHRCWELMTALRPYLAFRAAERRQALQPGEKLDNSNSRDDIADALRVARSEFKAAIYLYNQILLDNQIPRDFKLERIAAVEAGTESAKTAVHRMYKKLDDLNMARKRVNEPARQARLLANALPEAEALASVLEQIHQFHPSLDPDIKASAYVTLSRLRQAASRLARSANSPSKETPHEGQEESAR